jgi:hypothetical protein
MVAGSGCRVRMPLDRPYSAPCSVRPQTRLRVESTPVNVFSPESGSSGVFGYFTDEPPVHGVELQSRAAGERAQERARRGGGADAAGRSRHRTVAQHVKVIDAVRAIRSVDRGLRFPGD